MNSKTPLLLSLLFFAFLFSSEPAISQDKNWTHFRGSNLSGRADNEIIPIKWDESTIKWKIPVHDNGLSSPVVYGNQIWVTSAKTDGSELYAVCVDYKTGKLIYDIKVFTPEEVEGKHSTNTYASPTPCIEKGFAYVHYGSLGTACINTSNGSIVWKRNDLKCKHVQGPASSPVLYKNLLILHFEGVDVRYIVALDKATGKQVWRSDRPSEPYEKLTEIGRKAYTTPLLIKVKGKDMLISNGSALCIAYDPNTGREIWRVVGGAESTISMPFSEKGIVYWYTGYMVGGDGNSYADLLAVNPDGLGDITNTNVIWKKQHGLTYNQCLTPVIKDGLIYTVTSKRNMICLDASTGDEVWSTRVTANYDASPLSVNGNIWFFSVKGEAVAIRAGNKYEVVAQNQMDSGIWATPAVLRNSVILRTQKCLYRIGGE
jgi:outer membrane protein assembly factor BamB